MMDPSVTRGFKNTTNLLWPHLFLPYVHAIMQVLRSNIFNNFNHFNCAADLTSLNPTCAGISGSPG